MVILIRTKNEINCVTVEPYIMCANEKYNSLFLIDFFLILILPFSVEISFHHSDLYQNLLSVHSWEPGGMSTTPANI